MPTPAIVSAMMAARLLHWMVLPTRMPLARDQLSKAAESPTSAPNSHGVLGLPRGSFVENPVSRLDRDRHLRFSGSGHLGRSPGCQQAERTEPPSWVPQDSHNLPLVNQKN